MSGRREIEEEVAFEPYDYFMVYYLLALDDPYILIPTYSLYLDGYFFVPYKNFLRNQQ